MINRTCEGGYLMFSQATIVRKYIKWTSKMEKVEREYLSLGLHLAVSQGELEISNIAGSEGLGDGNSNGVSWDCHQQTPSKSTTAVIRGQHRRWTRQKQYVDTRIRGRMGGETKVEVKRLKQKGRRIYIPRAVGSFDQPKPVQQGQVRKTSFKTWWFKPESFSQFIGLKPINKTENLKEDMK